MGLTFDIAKCVAGAFGVSYVTIHGQPEIKEDLETFFVKWPTIHHGCAGYLKLHWHSENGERATFAYQRTIAGGDLALVSNSGSVLVHNTGVKYCQPVSRGCRGVYPYPHGADETCPLCAERDNDPDEYRVFVRQENGVPCVFTGPTGYDQAVDLLDADDARMGRPLACNIRQLRVPGSTNFHILQKGA